MILATLCCRLYATNNLRLRYELNNFLSIVQSYVFEINNNPVFLFLLSIATFNL